MLKNFGVLLILLGLFSCTSDDDVMVKDSIISIVKMGTWRITYFWDTDKDETDHFTGYNFTFGDGDVLTATNGANTYTGTWSIFDNSSSNSSDDLDFVIAFAAPPDFEELSEDWEIIEINETKIQLKHVSGGDGGTDFLTFEKN